MKKKISFEEGMQELEALVQALESGQMPLEDSFKTYERAMKLRNELSAMLDGRQVRLGDLWRRRSESRSNGVSFPVQCAAAASLDDIGRPQIKALVNGYRANARNIREGLTAAGLACYGGVNSPYVWLKTPGCMSSWEFFDALLRKAQVVGTPGAGFGAAGEGYFRLTAFNTAENTKRAVERIIEAF